MRRVRSSWELLCRISDNGIWDNDPTLLGRAIPFLLAHVITVGSPVTWHAVGLLQMQKGVIE